MSDIPQGWKRMRLLDIADKVPTGDRYDSNTVIPSGTIPVIDQSENGCVGFHNDNPGISAAIEDPVVTFANHTCAVRLMVRPFSTIQNVFAFRGNELADTRFLYHLLYKRIPMVFYGGHYPILTTEKLLIPPLPEQRKIAEILGSVDENIEKTQAFIAKLQDLKKATMQELLTKGIGHTKFKNSPVGRIPEEWLCTKLESFIAEGPTNGLYRPESDYGSVGTPIVRIDSFDDGVLHGIGHLRRVSLSDSDIARYSLREGDIVLNRVNSLSHIGKSVMIPHLRETSVFESNMMRVRTNESLLPELLSYILLSEMARTHWLMRAKVAVSQASINQTDVQELLIPYPPLPEQREIVEAIGSMDRCINQKQQYLTRTQYLKKALMQDLLTGKVRVKV